MQADSWDAEHGKERCSIWRSGGGSIKPAKQHLRDSNCRENHLLFEVVE